jgi:hypothetical protein
MAPRRCRSLVGWSRAQSHRPRGSPAPGATHCAQRTLARRSATPKARKPTLRARELSSRTTLQSPFTPSPPRNRLPTCYPPLQKGAGQRTMTCAPAYPKQALLSTGRCSCCQYSDTAPLLVHKRSQRDNATAGLPSGRGAAVPRTALAGRHDGRCRATTSPRPGTFCLFYLSAYNSRTPHLAMRSLANPHPLSSLSSLISHDSCTPTSPCAHSPHPSFATGRGRPDSSTLRLLDSAACTFPSSPRALSDSFRLSSAQPTTSSVSSSHLPLQLGVSSRKYRARPVLFHCLPGRGRFDSSPLRPPSGARVPPPSHWHHVHGRGYTPL